MAKYRVGDVVMIAEGLEKISGNVQPNHRDPGVNDVMISLEGRRAEITKVISETAYCGYDGALYRINIDNEKFAWICDYFEDDSEDVEVADEEEMMSFFGIS